MTNKSVLFAIVAVSAVAAAAFQPARADGIDVIAVRQAGMSVEGGNFAMMKAYVELKGDVTKVENPAKGIAKWAAVIPSLFPKGSDQGDHTKALPEVWTDSAGFLDASKKVQDAALKLATDAKAGSADLVAADVKELGEACGGCHKKFKAK